MAFPPHTFANQSDNVPASQLDDNFAACLPAAGGTVSGPLTVDGQLIGGGTTTNDNAAAGDIGEVIPVTWTTSAITSGVITDIADASLTAGDWDFHGGVVFNSSGAFAGAIGGPSTTSITVGPPGTYFQSAGLSNAFAFPGSRFSLAATTVVYIVIEGVFSGTGTSSGQAYFRRPR